MLAVATVRGWRQTGIGVVGNTVVLKASEICPATHRLIAEIMTDAGLPKGVVNVVTHAAEDAAE